VVPKITTPTFWPTWPGRTSTAPSRWSCSGCQGVTASTPVIRRPIAAPHHSARHPRSDNRRFLVDVRGTLQQEGSTSMADSSRKCAWSKGINDTTFFGRMVDKLAVAVSEPALQRGVGSAAGPHGYQYLPHAHGRAPRGPRALMAPSTCALVARRHGQAARPRFPGPDRDTDPS
jgi:hypothetical protein